jgi:SAM-dependent MidA family methyltransferase
MRYVVVERADPARAAAESVAGIEVLASLPSPGAYGDVGVVIANELLDNLSFKIVERAYDGWRELLVVDAGEQCSFAMGERVHRFDYVDAEVGARIPWHTHAVQWVAAARSIFRRSHVALFDYGTRTTTELAKRQWREWLRTYRDHGHGKDPLRAPGSQDITCDVAFDQLVPHALHTQADWLRLYGIDDFVAAAKATWHERAAIGDLEALKARSRVSEADALTDPAGPGGFLVAEWSTP